MADNEINEQTAELENLVQSDEFKEFLKGKNIDISVENLESIREARKEYEDNQEQDSQQSQPEGSNVQQEDKGAINVGQDSKDEDTNKIDRDENKISLWKDFAEKNGYAFEENDEPEYAYSVRLTKDGKESSIKGKDNNLYVKSEDLNIYREIVRQAKEDNYTSINLLDNLDEKQKHMLLFAAIEQGLKIENAPKVLNFSLIGIDPNDEAQLSKDMKKKLTKYAYGQMLNSMQKDIERFKTENPDQPYKLKDLSNKNRGPEINKIYKAMQIYLATKNDIKIEPAETVVLNDTELELIPVENLDEFQDALNRYNETCEPQNNEQTLQDNNEQTPQDNNEQAPQDEEIVIIDESKTPSDEEANQKAVDELEANSENEEPVQAEEPVQIEEPAPVEEPVQAEEPDKVEKVDDSNQARPSEAFPAALEDFQNRVKAQDHIHSLEDLPAANTPDYEAYNNLYKAVQICLAAKNGVNIDYSYYKNKFIFLTRDERRLLSAKSQIDLNLHKHLNDYNNHIALNRYNAYCKALESGKDMEGAKCSLSDALTPAENALCYCACKANGIEPILKEDMRLDTSIIKYLDKFSSEEKKFIKETMNDYVKNLHGGNNNTSSRGQKSVENQTQADNQFSFLKKKFIGLDKE